MTTHVPLPAAFAQVPDILARFGLSRVHQAVFDCETNGLRPYVNTVHFLGIKVREFENGPLSRTFRFRSAQGIQDALALAYEADCDGTIEDGLTLLTCAEMLIGHNIVAYDLTVFEELFPQFHFDGIVRDTLVMASMIAANEADRDFPRWHAGELPGALIGSHKLEAWGYRLGVQKGDYTKWCKEQGIDPWEKWRPEMEDYGVLDVEINALLWEKLAAVEWSEESIQLEHRIHHLMALQEDDGYPFDEEKCRELVAHMEEVHGRLSAEAVAHFGTWYTADRWRWSPDRKDNHGKPLPAEPRPEFGEDGSRRLWAEVVVPTKSRKYKALTGTLAGTYTEGEPYCKVKIKEFNPGSRPMIIDRLTTIYDWTPVDFTDKGNPVIDDDILRTLAHDWPICETLAELFFYQKMIGMAANGAQSWLNSIKQDGSIHGRVIVGGTVSGRAAHSSPNVAQVKKVKAGKDKQTGQKIILKGRDGEYGWECRSLFHPRRSRDAFGNRTDRWQNWKQVGADLKGIELRCFGARLAEFDGGAYLNLVLEGDPHTDNIHNFGLEDFAGDQRDTAKRVLYACVPMDTLCYTAEGWKDYDALRQGEMVWTYNPAIPRLELQPIIEKVFYPDAPVVEVTFQPHFKVRATPNHRWFASTVADNVVREVTTTDLDDHHFLLTDIGRAGVRWMTAPSGGIRKTELQRQPVWCIRTPNGSFVMQQAGTVTITGNTLYGGGNEKLGSIVLPPNASTSAMIEAGKRIRNSFETRVPAFGALMKKIKQGARRGFLEGLDGRLLYVRSPHSALNLLLQSDGALIAKAWRIIWHQMMDDAGYRLGWDGDYVGMAWVHDENQAATRDEELAHIAGKYFLESAVAAGEHFGYAAPVEADYKVGNSWAECH